MRRHGRPPSQTWRTFLDNHVTTLLSVDFFTVPTIRFHVLYVFLILAHDRGRILHVGVTAAYVERMIGTIRRECLDHVIVCSDRGLRHHLRRLADYYHRTVIRIRDDHLVARLVWCCAIHSL